MLLYAAFYVASDGQRYMSDDHQFGVYPDGYHAALDAELGSMLATARQRLRTPGETVAPLHTNGTSLYVYANVGGRFLRFIVDTGATYTALSARAARALGITGVSEDQQVVLSTAGGYVNAPIVTLGSIDVNGAIGAARECLTNNLLHAGRAGRADDDFAAVLLAKA